jgi:hypothetical protein
MIMARKANIAAIFRRGPTKWTQVIKWNTQNDTFEYGHWFKGRIYERRCDLSPDGTKLIYFVSKFNQKTLHDSEYTYAWTGISKLPWLTALALWPKGDCWHGGGMFESNNTIFLNHRPEHAIPHPRHQPKGLHILPNSEARGEDEPLYSLRLTRDGWNIKQEWEVEHHYHGGFVTKQPEIREYCYPEKQHLKIVMKKMLSGYRYWEEYELLNSNTNQCINLDGVEGANWDQRGRLVLLSQGKLYLGKFDELKIRNIERDELVDFNAQKPQEIESPDWAKDW